MSSVGAVTCQFVRGEFSGFKERTSTWSIPGVDGTGAQILGLGDAKFSCRIVFFGTAETCNAWQLSIEALQGAVVDIVDDFGITWADCFIASMTAPQRAAAIAPGGVTTRYEMEISGEQV